MLKKRQIYYPENHYNEEKEVDTSSNSFLEKKVVKVKRKKLLKKWSNLELDHKKVALVLSGGAARGFAHIGVIEVLEENGIVPDLIVGTSMGAIVGASYAMDRDLTNLKKHINVKIPDLISIKDFSLNYSGLIKGAKAISIMSSIVGRSTIFSELKIPLIINATNIRDGSEVIFKKGNVVDAVRASLSIPGIFTPYTHHDEMLVDGGVASAAADHLVPDDYDLIIMVDVNNDFIDLGKRPNIQDILEQMFVLFHKSKLKITYPEKTIKINPDLHDLKISDFGKSAKFIKRGRESAELNINKIKKILN